jgi:hypothetical protein
MLCKFKFWNWFFTDLDLKINSGSGSELANSFGSDQIWSLPTPTLHHLLRHLYYISFSFSFFNFPKFFTFILLIPEDPSPHPPPRHQNRLLVATMIRHRLQAHRSRKEQEDKIYLIRCTLKCGRKWNLEAYNTRQCTLCTSTSQVSSRFGKRNNSYIKYGTLEKGFDFLICCFWKRHSLLFGHKNQLEIWIIHIQNCLNPSNLKKRYSYCCLVYLTTCY